MIDLPYSLVIEATQEPDYFGFDSPELEGFTARRSRSQTRGAGFSLLLRASARRNRRGPRRFPRLVVQRGVAAAKPAG